MNFLANNEIEVVEAAAAAAQTELTSDIVDMKDWDAVTFIALTGDVADTCVLTLNVEHGDKSDGSDMADTELSASFTAGATSADSKVLAVEVIHPVKRYVRATLTRTTADAAIGGIIALKHGAKRLPITQDASVIDSDYAVAPATA